MLIYYMTNIWGRGSAMPVTITAISLLAMVFVLDYLIFPPKGAKRWNLKYLVLGSHAGLGKEPAPFNETLCLRTSALRRGQLWRLVTYLSLHGGLYHLLANCAALWALGSFLEGELGAWRWALLLLASGVAVGLSGGVLFGTAEFGIGASCAIYGAVGFFTAMLLRDPQVLQVLSLPWQIFLLCYLLSNFVLRGGWRCHCDGFACGILLAFVLI